jgi:hypothetical protein
LRQLEERRVRSIFAAITAAILTTSAGAAEKPVHLKSGPGLDKVEANCSGCHSLDYVPMNSPFLNAAGWDSEVAKMINAFGAPIDAGDAKIIAAYLKKNYGPERTQTPRVSGPTAGAQSLQSGRGTFPPSLQSNADQGNGSVPKGR